MGGIARYDCHMTHTPNAAAPSADYLADQAAMCLLGGDLAGAQALIDQGQALYPDHTAAGLSWDAMRRLAGGPA